MCLPPNKRRRLILAAVISLTMVKTGITIVSYFGNLTASLFALTIVRNLRLGDPKQYRLNIVIPKQGSWVSFKFTNKHKIRLIQKKEL